MFLNVFMFLYGLVRHSCWYGAGPYQTVPFAGENPRCKPTLEPFPYAKAGGSMLNMNCALILLPVCRNFVGWLRSTPLAEVIPFDNPVAFHRLVAWGIFVGFAIHFPCHVYDATILRDEGLGGGLSNHLFGNFAGFTGLLVLICMVAITATSFTMWSWMPFCGGWTCRRKKFKMCCGCKNTDGSKKMGGFTIFQKVHKLWALVIVLLWLHAPKFWIYSFWPFMLMMVERYIRAKRTKEPVVILEVRQHEKDVMGVKFCLKNGRKFKYIAGQYLFLQCPEIESGWHPFTITSAPEDDFVSCHIRCRKGMDFTFPLRKLLNPDDKKLHHPNPAAPRKSSVGGEGVGTHYSVKMGGAKKKKKGKKKKKKGSPKGKKKGKKGMPAKHNTKVKGPLGPAGPVPSESDLMRAASDAACKSQQARTADIIRSKSRANMDDGIRAERERLKGKHAGAGHYEVESYRGPITWFLCVFCVFFICCKLDKRDVWVDQEGRKKKKRCCCCLLPCPGACRDECCAVEPGTVSAADRGSWGPLIRIDGPYGAASEEVFRFKTLILVGAGIGVTPFASIMRSIQMQMRAKDGASGATEPTETHFFWICRSQDEFDSFKPLLLSIRAERKFEQPVNILQNTFSDRTHCMAQLRPASSFLLSALRFLHRYFHFNLYISGELNLTDPKMQAEMKAYSQWTQLFTGRPKWDRIFKEAKGGAEKRLGKTLPSGEPRRREIGVFLCGPPAIGKQLKKESRKQSSPQREEGGTFFSFHMEHF